jgi:hypothetical protein
VKVIARPAGASARLHGRPSIAGADSVVVAAGSRARIAVALNARAYRLMRAHHRLTLSVALRITRPGFGTVGSTFTITVKAPARKRH